MNYKISGHFYERTIGGNTETLRSVLNIKLSNGNLDGPDLIVIMMNPGSSTPSSSTELWDDWNLYEPKRMVEAKPDPTQKQIMAVMENCAFQYARILNISDIRTPKSNVFYEKLVQCKSDFSHSLFSPERKEELARELGDVSIPILAAWGLSYNLLPLSSLAHNSIQHRKVFGLKDPTMPLFRHPYPPRRDWQKQWVEAITEQFKI